MPQFMDDNDDGEHYERDDDVGSDAADHSPPYARTSSILACCTSVALRLR